MAEKTSQIIIFVSGVLVGSLVIAAIFYLVMKPVPQSPFDANGDGKINLSEFRAFQYSLFSLADLDKNSRVEHDEFQTLVKKMRPNLSNAVTATLRRKMVDEDADGIVTRQEFLRIEATQFLFSQLDENEDGHIGRKESDAPMAKILFPS